MANENAVDDTTSLTREEEDLLDKSIRSVAKSELVKKLVHVIAEHRNLNIDAETADLCDLDDEVIEALQKGISENPDRERIALRRVLVSIEKHIQGRFVGQEELVRTALISLVLNEHTLLEGLPGTGKTVFVQWLAQVTGLPLSRVQFIPDMLPSDLIGKDHIDPVGLAKGDRSAVSWINGPVFGSIVLADEINRAPSKVQAALLEAMGERQATPFGKMSRPVLCPLHEAALLVWHATPGSHGRGLLGTPRPIPAERDGFKEHAPFTVFATMNPIEQEGTYPLSEAQLDRFCFKVLVPYPSRGHYDTLAASVYENEPFRAVDLNLSEAKCRQFLVQHPKYAVPLLLPVYFFLKCRSHVIPVRLCDHSSLYQQLQNRESTRGDGAMLQTIFDIVYMTNARSGRLGEAEGRISWYEKEQTDMREFLDDGCQPEERAEKLRRIREQQLCQYVRSGASPRGFLKLIPAALCHAMFRDSGAVEHEDILATVYNVLRHRIHMDVHARLAGVTTEQVIQSVCHNIMNG